MKPITKLHCFLFQGLIMLGACCYSPNAFANANIRMNLYNGSNQPFYITYMQSNMEGIDGPYGYELAPGGSVSYSGTDQYGPNAVMINGLNGVSFLYTGSGFNSSPSGPTTSLEANSTTCSPGGSTYTWYIIQPPASNTYPGTRATDCSTQTAAGRGWGGGNQLLCTRNASNSGSCISPNVSIDVLIPSDFPAPRDMPS